MQKDKEIVKYELDRFYVIFRITDQKYIYI